MALTKPPSFTFNYTDQADILVGDPTTNKTKLDSRAKELRDYLNDTLTADLDTEFGAQDTALANLAGAGRTIETVKGNTDALASHLNDPDPHSQYVLDTNFDALAGDGHTTETVKGNADALMSHINDIVQTDEVNSSTKYPSAAVTYALGQEIDTITQDMGNLKTPMFRESIAAGNSLTFNAPSGVGIYLVLTTHGGVLVNTRSAHLVFCAYEGSNGTVAPIRAGSDIVITSNAMEIKIINNSAGTCIATIVQLN